MAGGACVISVPKSGTHLMVKTLFLLGFEPCVGLMADRFDSARRSGDGSCVMLGLGRRAWVPATAVDDALRVMPESAATSTHAPFAEALEAILQRHGFTPVHVLRDPRDVALSQAHWWTDVRAKDRIRRFVADMPLGERAMLAAVGGDLGGSRIRGVADQMERSLPWRDRPGTVAVRFEDLVGEPASASVSALAVELGITITPRRADQIARLIPGDTLTFRRGVVGSWCDELPDEFRGRLDDALGPLAERLGYPR